MGKLRKMSLIHRLYLMMLVLVIISSSQVELAKADVYDEDEDDWDDEDWDDWDDWDDENTIKEYSYDNVKKTFDLVKISESTGHTYPIVDNLPDGKTNIYPINIKNSTKYTIGFTDYITMGKASILVIDATGKQFMERQVDLIDEGWKKTVYLPKGKYYIKILAKDEELELGFEYELYIKPSVTVKKETKKITMNSCHTKKLASKLGKGKWTTSNKNIVSIDSKNPNNNSVCTIRAKKAGIATITYKNDSGSVLKYKITVKTKTICPLEKASFSMDSVGGLEPTIYIANNSDKKIKYIYITVSFYNAVGDKLRNEIGGYTSANLQITGYINPWHSDWYEWDPVFYDYSARKMKIESFTIIYSDGSKKSMTINKKYSIS